MSKPQFDRNRPFGTISPYWHGAGFHQDGCYFSPQGEFLFREGERSGDDDAASDVAGTEQAPAAPEAKTKKKTTAKSRAKKPAADTPEKPGGDAAEQAGANPAPEVDLAKWAAGEQTVPFFTVKKVFLEKYPDGDTKNADTIKAQLAEAGVI